MYTWLEKDLSEVDRELTPWVILALHRPMYNTENYEQDYEVAIHMQQLLEPLLIQGRLL